MPRDITFTDAPTGLVNWPRYMRESHSHRYGVLMLTTADRTVGNAATTRSRQHRAEQERADTLDRVLAAARSRFLSQGYAGTKMLDIAAEAGVALASVYRAGRSKAELIEMIVERTNAGGDPEGTPERSRRHSLRTRPPDRRGA